MSLKTFKSTMEIKKELEDRLLHTENVSVFTKINILRDRVLGIKHNDFCRFLRISPSTLTALERGHNTSIGSSAMYKLEKLSGGVIKASELYMKAYKDGRYGDFAGEVVMHSFEREMVEWGVLSGFDDESDEMELL